jgi:catechol 2,3-dioxygenase-like lactoylglutathione lyase family enzyme
MICNFILYVCDQEASTRFYQTVLDRAPQLHVPGMTEFRLSGGCVLGLMPEKGIKRLLGAKIQDPEKTNGIARAEVYLSVDFPEIFLARAMTAGGRLLSPLEPRNWGDTAAYVADPDGHVVAFASRT